MKNLPIILSSLALLGVAVLLGLKLSEKKDTRTKSVHREAGTKGVLSGVKIGFVDIDTLENNYSYFKQKKAEFEVRQKSIDAELERTAGSLQNDYIKLQNQAKAGTLSESAYEAAQQNLMQRQQDLELKRQNLGSKFLKDQEIFNKEIHDNLHAYIEKYNVDMEYDYIFSYTKDGSILYADEALDITNDIIEGMNSDTKGQKNSTPKESKK
ncbi:MAG: OmpH family outer membrane protein [Bacteroidetes bacterium]|nr:OmpH family outer membrane protein [Bacteroidota bacterium]